MRRKPLVVLPPVPRFEIFRSDDHFREFLELLENLNHSVQTRVRKDQINLFALESCPRESRPEDAVSLIVGQHSAICVVVQHRA